MPQPLATRRDTEISNRAYRAGVAVCALAVGAFGVVQRAAWPPFEDEALALFVGRDSFGGMLATVLNERGGAPLHFLLAWCIAHAGGGLVALRLVSVLFAVASVPLVAALVARIGGRTAALVATAVACASWALLFHGVYGRMYALFLFTSTLSYLALLAAVDRGGRRWWALWVLAIYATLATHPYGALVLLSQAIYVAFSRSRVREAVAAGAVVAVAGIPFWRADLVLRGRFDVGVGAGEGNFGGPLGVLTYLAQAAGDFSAYGIVSLPLMLMLAAIGSAALLRARRREALLVVAVLGTPLVVFLVTRLGGSSSPETRHLIFALPFFSALIGTGVVEIACRTRRLALALAIALAALIPLELSWAHERTPELFAGESRTRAAARADASAWLERTGHPRDVLLGYDPLFLGAWERDPRFSDLVVPRADAALASRTLTRAEKPLGRGIWVLDASDANNAGRSLTIERRVPEPRERYEARVYGPFLIVRSREPTRTPRRFLEQTLAVMRVGQSLYIGDADVNKVTAEKALKRLER
ncbi:MAG: glycosyltransferase family 39 protein [Actinomycetota bacterium]|nr:glycosyltransferase family 39 protein [Actinomycetota bacterium]